VDNNFVVGKFFASFIMPNSYAINPDDADDSEDSEDSVDTGADPAQEFKDKMIEIARAIANDTYTDSSHPSGTKYTYLWGGDGGYAYSPKNGAKYCVFDCRGLVAGSIRYASRALNFHKDKFEDFYITSTKYEYGQLIATGLWGCHKVTSASELQDGDILWRSSHTELFFRTAAGKNMQVGAHQTSKLFLKDESCGGGYGSCDPEDSIEEYSYGEGSWEAYFRYGTVSDYTPTGSFYGAGADGVSGQLGEGRLYSGEVDEKAELDEQVFDFQGNPQKMVYDGTTNFNMWLFTLLSQFLDFIAGLLVSLLINPIMQLLNAIVNFLTNFINYISGLPMGT